TAPSNAQLTSHKLSIPKIESIIGDAPASDLPRLPLLGFPSKHQRRSNILNFKGDSKCLQTEGLIAIFWSCRLGTDYYFGLETKDWKAVRQGLLHICGLNFAESRPQFPVGASGIQ
ncbi:hypothetical protein SUGI_0649020, partial [Cryptomeria japonica]